MDERSAEKLLLLASDLMMIKKRMEIDTTEEDNLKEEREQYGKEHGIDPIEDQLRKANKTEKK